MWSQVILCLFVGLAYATDNPAWRNDYEYLYKVHGRTMALVSEDSQEYSGMILNATLKIQPREDGKVYCQIQEPQYAQMQWKLPSWLSPISEKYLSWKPLDMSSKPFYVEVESGIIKNIVVSKDTSNWEANMYKSIVSQFQLNTKGKNPIQSEVNNIPEEGQNYGMFKTMEETVTGQTETLYRISPYPEYMSVNDTMDYDMRDGDDLISVFKHKNYTNNEELPSYAYGFGEMSPANPATNKLGSFFVREYAGYAMLTGSLKSYTVQISSTTEIVKVKPTLDDQKMSSVVSYLEVRLQYSGRQSDKMQEVSEPLPLGNLVYTYEMPNSQSNDVRRKRQMTQDKSPLDQPPLNPLLPLSVGYKGNSIKNGLNIVKLVIEYSRDISKYFSESSQSINERVFDRFVKLTSLIRLMDSRELAQVTNQLYHGTQEGPKHAAWSIFRDALATSGTGPALLTIQKLIMADNLKGNEASDVMYTMAKSVRHPTIEYMRTLFELIKSPEVQQEWPLNDTSLISFSELAWNVYVHKQRSQNQFPVKAFGSFFTEEGHKFVEDEVIPYFAQKLQDAIVHADAHKIHVYIRTLGNVAHPKILEVFEPYLEGKKQVSQFQRFLMVLSLDKLAHTYPKKAQSVLLKIYQNPGEAQEVRIAAVYQLIKSDVPADIAQSMAIHTLADKHEYVNAAVKSYLENAANVRPRHNDKMQSAARSAKPFLTKKMYGLQNGAKYVRDYFYQSADNFYRNSFDYITNEDELMPKKIQYTMDSNLGGVVQSRLLSVKAMVSSFEELLRVAKQQTNAYEQQSEKLQSQYRQHQQNKFSSENIAKMLNMKSEEREQLEGALFMKLGAPYMMFGFDNMTMQQLSEVVRDWEQQLNDGKKFNSIRISNSEELAVSFPNVMGLPFLYTYDRPTVFKVQGFMQATASPQISQRNKLYTPDNFHIKTDLNLAIGSGVLGRLSFTTPFDHQQYFSGFDKKYQAYVPFSSDVEIDMKNMEVKAEIQPKVANSEDPVFSFSSCPFTSRIDVLKSVSLIDEARIVYPDNVRSFDRVFGEEYTGMAFRVQIKRDRASWEPRRIMNTLMQEGFLEAFMQLYGNQEMMHNQIKIYHLIDQSSNNKMVLKASFQEKYQDKKSNAGESKPWWHYTKSNGPRDRQLRYMEAVSKHVDSAKLQSGDYSVEFLGGKPMQYTLTTGRATSMSDTKSHFIYQMRKTSDHQEVKPYEMSLEMKNSIPHENYFDMDQSLDSNPVIHSEIELSYGQSKEHLSKLQANVEFSRSEERRQYLKKHPMYEQCKQEMSEGNKQLSACVYMNMEAQRLDKVDVGLVHENVQSDVTELLNNLKYTVPSDYYNAWTVQQERNSRSEREVLVQTRFDEDFNSFNISIQKKGEQYQVNNIGLNKWSRAMLVQNPLVDLKTRLMAQAFQLPNYRPFCTVDQTQANTFENKMYPAQLSKQWAVMFQYVPKQARKDDRQMSVFEQLMSQFENYVILIRENERQNQKDIKMTFSSPETDFELLDITMTPRNNEGSVKSRAQVMVNGQEVEMSENSYSMKKGFVEMFTLPNGEVMVMVRDRWYVIYDGHRARMSLLNGHFASSMRGLCGQWNGMVREDFATPEECIVRDYKQFIRSYELGTEGEQVRQSLSNRKSGCFDKVKPIYEDVVSDSNTKHSENQEQQHDECMNIQTRYIEEQSQICFTIRPMPSCHKGCKANGSINKNIPVHCIPNSPIAQLWKSQIDRGTSPDFSEKKTTKAIYMQLPESCSQ